MYEVLNAMRENGLEKRKNLLPSFEEMSKNPMAVQTNLLLNLLREEEDVGRRLHALAVPDLGKLHFPQLAPCATH